MSDNVKTSKYSSVKNILIITLSNIGDAVLTLPVLAHLSVIFLQPKITLLCGPRAVPVFIDDSRISELIIYDKHISFRSKLSLLREMRARRFDLIVDLRNTLMPVLLGAKERTSFWRRPPRNLTHKHDVHLWKLKSLGFDIDRHAGPLIWLNEADKGYAQQVLSSSQSKSADNTSPQIAALAPGARSHIKRWPEEYFVELGRRLLEGTDIEKIILLGSKDEMNLCQEIGSGIMAYNLNRLPQDRCLNLAGQTTLKQAAAVLAECRFLVSNDSALMHIGSAVGIPVIGIFGPTDEAKYSPLSPGSLVIRNKLRCAPCESAQCRLKAHDCLQQLSPHEVMEKITSQKNLASIPFS